MPPTKGRAHTTSRRYWFGANGARYVAQDRLQGGVFVPEHAVWEDGRLIWHPHTGAELLEPFDGPADVWLELVEGAWPHAAAKDLQHERRTSSRVPREEGGIHDPDRRSYR